MARQEAESSNRLSIFWLKKHGYLPQGDSFSMGGISWSYGMSEKKNSIGFSIKAGLSAYIRLQYTHTSNWTGEKESMDYEVRLTPTACNYGGVRYWFLCPLSRGGMACGRRVGVLYGIGKWFGCRYCGDVCYAAQNEGGRFRICSITDVDVEKMENEMKRWYYRGEPTRKHRRLMRMREKNDMGWMMLAARVDKNFAKRFR